MKRALHILEGFGTSGINCTVCMIEVAEATELMTVIVSICTTPLNILKPLCTILLTNSKYNLENTTFKNKRLIKLYAYLVI